MAEPITKQVFFGLGFDDDNKWIGGIVVSRMEIEPVNPLQDQPGWEGSDVLHAYGWQEMVDDATIVDVTPLAKTLVYKVPTGITSVLHRMIETHVSPGNGTYDGMLIVLLEAARNMTGNSLGGDKEYNDFGYRLPGDELEDYRLAMSFVLPSGDPALILGLVKGDIFDG